MGVSFIASGFSGNPRQLAQLINQGMNHKGFSMVHVQSPCVTYNDTFQLLKGNAKEGIEPLVWDIPEEHDSSSKAAAHTLIQKRGLPVGVIYQDDSRLSLDDRVQQVWNKDRQHTVEELIDAYAI